MYEVSTFEVRNRYGLTHWTPVGLARSKDEAIRLADEQGVRAIVTPRFKAKIIHDNRKPHGGVPVFQRGCPCPSCMEGGQGMITPSP